MTFSKRAGKTATGIAICVVLILAGAAGMIAMASIKGAPAEVGFDEQALAVRTIQVAREDATAVISGYGEARTLNVVSISPEVPGRTVHVHPRLEAGEIVRKGETIFMIDPRNYQAVRDDAASVAERLEDGILRLEKECEINARRMKTLARNRDLAKAEYERFRVLFHDKNIGSKSDAESAERLYNEAIDAADQMEQTLAVCPIRIREAKHELASAKAKLETAEADLDRCKVTAPFDGRVITAGIETGQYVVPGQELVSLADDSALEILVPLESAEARQWLQFKGEPDLAWFPNLDPVTCRIWWTEDETRFWEGKLHRVVAFGRETRTTTVAVRIGAEDIRLAGHDGPPLVAGMFCRVAIPGKIMRDVMRLPVAAVSFENTVFSVSNGRLKTVPVKVARIQDECAFVSEGISSGDMVITTRLVSPVENSLLSVVDPGK